MEYKLSDTSIAQIVQLMQLGILTGTDVSDQIRTLRLTLDEKTNKLMPSESYLETFNENLKKLQTQAETMLPNE